MRKRQKINPTAAAGFTLIELLVVVVIMVMAYALAAPLVSTGVSSAELKASARQLAAGLRKARSEAVSRKHETVLTVDVEGRRFELSGDQRTYQLPKDIEINLFTAKSELINEKTGAIRFYPDGGSTGGRITVAVRDRKYAVDVNWLTGQVVILE
ncbi:MAG: GspH/FimT family pseudopilin [Pseudomonadota bacterium]